MDLKLELEEIRLGLGKFKHHMLKEIYEQPEALLNTTRGRVKRNEASGNLEVGNLNYCVYTKVSLIMGHFLRTSILWM